MNTRSFILMFRGLIGKMALNCVSDRLTPQSAIRNGSDMKAKSKDFDDASPEYVRIVSSQCATSIEEMLNINRRPHYGAPAEIRPVENHLGPSAPFFPQKEIKR